MNYKQFLVELIKTGAGEDELGDAPGVTPMGPPAPKPSAGPAGHGVGNPQVKRMQQALMNLSQAVVSQINIKDLANPDNPLQQQGEAAGRDSFNNFIAKSYLRNSDVPGVEFDPDAKKTQMNQKTPSTPTRMGVIMDTMARIGSSKSEAVVDGRWGPRTNAGLRNAYALAYSLLNLAKDFKVPLQSYNEEQLAKLKELIPDDEAAMNVLSKVEAAPVITEHLKNIQRMYQEIKAHILEKPAYRAYIEGDQPFATYQKAGAGLTKQQIDAINAAFGNKLQVYNKPISISDLLSAEAFNNWVKKNVPQVPAANVLETLKNQVATTQRDTKALSERT